MTHPSPKLESLRRLRRFVYMTLILAGLLLPATGQLMASSTTQEDGPRQVVVLTFSGAVTPVLHQYLQNGIETAQQRRAAAVILRLDTPGGSVDVTQDINQTILASSIPIMVYVSPSGAHAGSAGTFITLAGHVAAMAPGTSIGAASPVSGDGQEIGDTMKSKVVNILSADIENLAQRRGEKAVEWAIAAVRDAAAATAPQALELGVIDFIAADLDDLLTQADGFEITLQGQPYTLKTRGAVTEFLEMGPLQQFLNFITDPSVASILLSLGSLGLIVELRAPGFGAPGIVGVICLLLAFFALGQLDADFTGVALIALSIVLLVAELFTPTFGVLALGGVIAFVLGGMLIFDDSALGVPWPTLITMAVLMGGFTLFVGTKALAAQRRQPLTGGEGLIGQSAMVKTGFQAGEPGSVFLAGEWWNAQLEEGGVQAGDQVKVVGRQGYQLRVRRQG